MKNNLLIIFFLVSIISANAQPTIAQDWTKTDCSGNSQHLFSYLDSNKVVVMLFEMGCGGCVAGGQALEGMKQYFDATAPGKVKFFAMDYWVGQTCAADVIPFLTTNNFTYPGFDHCLAEKNYYTTVSPMPMIAVASGTSHALSYLKTSYAPNDSLPIFNAIDSSLAYIAGINELQKIGSFQLFPNPAVNETTLSFSLSSETIVTIEIENVLGKKIMSLANENKEKGLQKIKFNTQTLSKGIYFINVNIGSNSTCLKFIVN